MDTKRSSRPQKDASLRSNRPDVADENTKPNQNKNSSRPAEKKADVVNPKKTENSSAKTPQATADQMRIAQMFQNAGSSEQVLKEQILRVQECTGCTPDEAVIALHDTNSDIEAAVNLVLEGGANKNEWEVTGKKGKKQKSLAKANENNDQDMPVGMSNKSARGRPAQRGTSNRGGKSSAPSAPRAPGFGGDADESSGFNGARNSNRDRAPSPTNGAGDVRGRGPADGTRGRSDQEHAWGEDIDDDWKETIRETKVFERSAATAPSVSQVYASNTSQPVQPAQSGAGQSFSAIVQKQAASAWPASPVTAPTNQDSGWRSSAAATSQKPPPPSSHLADPTSSASQSFGPKQSSTFPTSVELKPDAAQLGATFSNLSFNNRNAAPETSSQVPSASQSFTRTGFNQTNVADFGAARLPVNSNSNEQVKPSPTAQSASTSAGSFASATQSQTFTSSHQDGPAGYASRNSQPVGLQQPSAQTTSKSPNLAETPQSLNQHQVHGSSQYTASSTQQAAGDSRYAAASQPVAKPPVTSQPVQKLETPSYPNQRATGLNQSQNSGQQPAQVQQQQQQQFQPPLQQQNSPPGKQVSSAASAQTNYASYGAPAGDTSSRTSFSGYQSTQTPQNLREVGNSGQQQQQQHQQPANLTSASFSSQKSQTTTAPVFSTPTSKTGYGNQTTAANPSLNQHYQQPIYNQQGVLPMFTPPVYSSMEAMNDPRVMQQQGMNMDYSSYGGSGLGGRDQSGGIGYSTVDHNKYRNDSGLGGGQPVPISQQQAGFVQPHMNAFPGYYASPVAGGYQQYGQPPIYQNIPSQYSKPTGALQNTFQQSYSDLGLDIKQNAYAASGMRATSNVDPYNTSNMLGVGDLQSAYYGNNKKQFPADKPAQQGFGMGLGNQQTGYAGNQYAFPMMQQQQQPIHSMAQIQQPGSSISNQNAANNKQNKPGPYQYNWPHQ